MASEHAIYDAAATIVSGNKVLSADQESVTAEACRRLTPILFENLIYKAQWRWATKRAWVNADTGADVVGEGSLYPEWKFRFPTPDDFTRYITIIPPRESENENVEGLEEHDAVYVRASAVRSRAIMRYVSGVFIGPDGDRVPDFARMRGPFIECLTVRLAAELASKLRRDENMARRLYIQFERAERDAYRVETPFEDYPTRTLTEVTRLQAGPEQ